MKEIYYTITSNKMQFGLFIHLQIYTYHQVLIETEQK